MSDSVQPHRRQPTRLPHPWDSPGKNTRVGCHFLLQFRKVKSESEVAQLCTTLYDPMDCSLPDSSIHGIFQARVLEWVAIAFSHKVCSSPYISTTCMQFLHAVPGTCERDLIWKGSLCRYKRVQLLALGLSVSPSVDPGPVYRCLVAPSTNHIWVLSLPGHAQLETHQRYEQWGKLQTLSWTLGPSCSVPSPFRHSASRPAPAFSPSDAVLCSGEAWPCWVSDESPGDESGLIFVSAPSCHSL